MIQRLPTPVLSLAAAAAALGLAAACRSVGPDYIPPQAEVPAHWHEPQGAGLAEGAAGEAPLPSWWAQLEDPLLADLVTRALEQGTELREAQARVREARALSAAARGERVPSLQSDSSLEERGESEQSSGGEFFAADADSHTARLGAGWELDLWGRVRRLVEAADADLAARAEDARAAALGVASETALGYVELRASQARAAIQSSNVELQTQTLQLVRARFSAGLVSERDVAQAASNLETTRARVPALQQRVRAAQNRLAVLLAVAPGELAAELDPPGPIPAPPLEVAVGVPTDLLRRRPDVRRAERELAAESARIGVARAELYPRLTLGGNLGLGATNVADLMHSGAGSFGAGPAIRWNLFSGGRLRSLAEAQDARTEQARVRWERTVLRALEESENAMAAFVREQQRRHSLEQASAHARSAVEIAQSEYRHGLTDFQSVLDSQRALALLEDERAESTGAVASNLIVLYRALGGGWEPGEPSVRR